MDTRYIECDEHGPRRHAYIICTHLRDQRDRSLIGHHKPWRDTEDGAGELLCATPGDQHAVGELIVICEDHLLDMGLLLPGETRLT